ncbi:MAG TPA: transposase [Phycisphaerales bacterium]|nr:transposase [Phycisphaerales bacterium]
MDQDPDQTRQSERHHKSLRHFENGSVRFFTFSCFDRLPLLGTGRLRTAFCDHLEQVRATRGFAVLAYCVMPEHVHLVLDPCTASNTAPSLLLHLKRPFSSMVLDRWRSQNAKVLGRVTDKKGRPHFWLRSGGFDRNVRVGKLGETVEYVNQNPVGRGLCVAAEDWEWSSARYYGTGEPGAVTVTRAALE